MSDKSQPEYPKWELKKLKEDYDDAPERHAVIEVLSEESSPHAIADIVKQDDPQDPKRPAKPGQYPYWRVSTRNSDGRGYLHLESVATFKELDHAFKFVTMVRGQYLVEIARRPLPPDLNRYIELRAKTLRERMKEAANVMLDLHVEANELLELARKHGVREAEFYIDDSDIGKAVDDMVKFKLSDDDYDDPLTPETDVPFFSEACLYPLIGKDAARTLLGRFERLIRLVSPSKFV